MIDVTTVRHVGGYQLALSFSDGTSGIADLELELHGALEPLRDEALFSRAFVRDGTVNWSDELDLAPERLYAHAHGLPMPLSGEQAQENLRTMEERARGRR